MEMKLDYVMSAAVLSLVGCAAVEPAPGDDNQDPTPQVLAIEPANNAVGVRENASIKLTFSEPMDTASVEAAFSAPQIGAVTFIWNLSNTEVTIVPGSPLRYADGVGDDPSVVQALTYELVLQTSAVSQQGMPLAAATASVFSTLKQMDTTAPIYGDMTMHVSNTGSIALPDTDLRVGDGVANTMSRGLITFNLSAITDRAVEIESARLRAIKTSVVGDPFAINPSISSYHISFTDPVAGYSVEPLATMGTFASASTGGVSEDVTSAVADDLAHRVDRQQMSQFRIQFDAGTDGDGGQDYAVFGRNTLELKLRYLSP